MALSVKRGGTLPAHYGRAIKAKVRRLAQLSERKLREFATLPRKRRRNESYRNYDAEHKRLIREVAKSHNALYEIRQTVEQYQIGKMPPSVYDSVSQLVIRAREAEEELADYEDKMKAGFF